MDVEGKLQQAVSLYQAGQLQQAERKCQQILRDNSQHAEALHLLGVIAHQAGENNVATGLITQAIKIDSNQFISHYEELRGDIFAKQGKIKKAEQAYHSALNEQINTEEAKDRKSTRLNSSHW